MIVFVSYLWLGYVAYLAIEGKATPEVAGITIMVGYYLYLHDKFNELLKILNHKHEAEKHKDALNYIYNWTKGMENPVIEGINKLCQDVLYPNKKEKEQNEQSK